MEELLKLPIRELQNLITQKKLSYSELIQIVLERIEKNRDLNGFISIFSESALKEAKIRDEELEKTGRARHYLFGIPVAIKDNIAVKDAPLTCASRILANFISPYDATVVAKLKEVGAIIIGKTNLDEFAMGSSNEHSFFGPVLNPLNKKYVPGGSSGGSAAVVAGNLVPVALGSDTGGSIRQPAAFCGICGLKPTYGRVSRFGLVAFASSLDVIGPITRSVEDCAILLETIAGYDIKDSTSANLKKEQYLPLNPIIKDVKVGVSSEFFFSRLEEKVYKAYEELVKELTKNGCKVIEISLPNLDKGIAAYYLVATAEASSNLARYDGVRYGLSFGEDLLWERYGKIRSAGFGKEVKRRIIIGTYSLAKGYYEEYYGVATKVRNLIRQDFLRAFKEVDLIISPTTPTPAFKLNEKLKDPIAMYLSDIFTVPISLAGLPAISIPLKEKVDGLPLGLQIIGPYFQEKMILDFAHGLEKL